jgi:hypothetical protein
MRCANEPEEEFGSACFDGLFVWIRRRSVYWQFRFADLDIYPTSNAPDQQYQQLIQHGQSYVLAHFPIGSSVGKATAALTNAGASCGYDSDPGGSGEYVCYYNERALGMAYFFETIVWSVVIRTDTKSRRIENISIDTWEDGL